jgi:hypothetical protein
VTTTRPATMSPDEYARRYREAVLRQQAANAFELATEAVRLRTAVLDALAALSAVVDDATHFGCRGCHAHVSAAVAVLRQGAGQGGR